MQLAIPALLEYEEPFSETHKGHLGRKMSESKNLVDVLNVNQLIESVSLVCNNEYLLKFVVPYDLALLILVATDRWNHGT